MSPNTSLKYKVKTNGAQVILKTMLSEGVDIIFGYPGGTVLPIYDELPNSPIRHILCRHEQGAVLAADGYARATGKVGVCMATSGPGATNLVTGLANAMLDSIPMVALTGQVSTDALGTDAFQEVDTLGMTMPVVKHSFLVRKPENLQWVLREAFNIARSGRPGPVLVDLPKNVQTSMAPFAECERLKTTSNTLQAPSHLDSALALIRSAKSPVIYAGGGVGIAKAQALFKEFVDRTKIPTVTTLKGLGLLSKSNKLNLGMLGMHGLQAANLAVQESDLLIVLGARFDDRVTGKLSGFAPNAKVLHFDIDPAEIGKVREADVAIKGDLAPALKQLNKRLDLTLDIEPWRERCQHLKSEHIWNYHPHVTWRDFETEDPQTQVYGPRLLKNLSKSLGPNGVIACDVGQHQMWVAQHCDFHRPENHLSSGGLGTMGFGLPAAIGANLGRPCDKVINVTGDGSFMMNLQELATLNRYKIPVKIVLMDNSCLGMVRQWQELFLEERYSETLLNDNPDFARVARAFGLKAKRIWREDQEDEGISWLLRSRGPALLHVVLDDQTNVWPFVPPGNDNSSMMKGVDR